MSDSSSLEKIVVVIPVYNDITNMVEVLAKFSYKIVDEICIVIDCATRNDLEEIEKTAMKIRTRVHVIKNEERKGIGYAIREGLEHALSNGYSIAVVMAGNGKDDPNEIPKLINPILKGEFDYVQGSRFLPEGKRVKNPFFRGVFSYLYPFLWTLLTKSKCTDVTNGFRAFNLKILKDRHINIWQDWLNGYQLEYYIHYKAITLGYKIKEVPVSKVYSHRHKGGYSKISPFKDWWAIVSPILYLKLGAKK